MRTPPPSQLGALREGLLLLRCHPALSITLALLAMGLAQLGPALELAAGVKANPLSQLLFGFAGLLPLEMYFIPRLQAQLDAESRNGSENPAGGWQAAFDTRWLRAFLAHLGLSVAVGLGLVIFLVPGLFVLALFGWAPLRMLLRGEDLPSALRWSQRAMARHWPRIVQAVLALALVWLLYMMATGWAMIHILPPMDPDLGPDAHLRLRHPAFWVLGLTGGALNLWVSCALLALYQRLERAVQTPD